MFTFSTNFKPFDVMYLMFHGKCDRIFISQIHYWSKIYLEGYVQMKTKSTSYMRDVNEQYCKYFDKINYLTSS